MDPWTRFEHALQTMEEPGPELHAVRREIRDCTAGSQAGRVDLGASVAAMLAYVRDLSLEGVTRPDLG